MPHSVGFERVPLASVRKGRVLALFFWDTSSSRLGKSGDEERARPSDPRAPDTAGDELRIMTLDMAEVGRRGARVRRAHLRAVVRNSVEVAPLGWAISR